MNLDLDKKALATLLRGTSPPYELMDHPLIKNKGEYRGGFNDEWVWDYCLNYSEEELYAAYKLIKDFKATPIPAKKEMSKETLELYNILHEGKRLNHAAMIIAATTELNRLGLPLEPENIPT